MQKKSIFDHFDLTELFALTHFDRVTAIWYLDQHWFRQMFVVITATRSNFLSTELLGKYFSEIWMKIRKHSYIKYLQMSSSKWRPFCSDRGVISGICVIISHSATDVLHSIGSLD